MSKIERARILAATRVRPDLTDLPAYLRVTGALERGGRLGDLVIPPPVEALRALIQEGRALGCRRVELRPDGTVVFEWST